jgi:beta-glucanase (GH16 family)
MLAFRVPRARAALALAAVALPAGLAFAAPRLIVPSVPAARGMVALTSAEAVAPPKGKPEFSATFSGKLNAKVWDTCYPSFAQSAKYPGCTNLGNKEYEWYVRPQVKVSGGELHLIAKRQNVTGLSNTGARKVYACRSGMVTSFPGFKKFRYGFIQVVADVPHKAGLWPAVWLLAANGKFPPEIDMIETWGVNHEEAAFFHGVKGGYEKGSVPLSLTEGWQTYSLRWTSSSLTYYVGNRTVLTVKNSAKVPVPRVPMYLLADLAEYLPIKGNPTACNGQLLIKSVKVWSTP